MGVTLQQNRAKRFRLWKAGARLTAVVAAVLSFCNPLIAKRKDDVVVMSNGDRFTGEIRKLDNGILYFKASYMLESVQLDWDRVDRLESQDQFFVATKEGKRYAGTVVKEGAGQRHAGFLRIETAGKSMEIQQQEVISILPREEGFWSQLKGSVDYGLSYTSGNSAISSALNGAVEYQRTQDFVSLETSSQFSGQSRNSTNRYTFDGEYFRILRRRWFYGGLFDLLKSDQQDLNLRTTFGGAFGRALILTDKTRFRVFAGAVGSRERYFPLDGVTPIRDNAETVFGAKFNTFRFKVLDLQNSTLVYPSLSVPGRVRIVSDSNVHIELVKDFYWDFHLYENFDSQPPESARRNDLGVTTGLGWKF